MQVADEILWTIPFLTKWYGTFPIGEHGVFTINRTKAKMLLGRKLSQQRKPSAYNAFSVLHYVMVALHYSTLHRFEIFSAPGTIARSSIRLPPRSLASSQGCSLAIITQAN